ncbi:MAG TPA: hypothetical protein VF159_01770 [Gemmatimonadaceae bacterium]
MRRQTLRLRSGISRLAVFGALLVCATAGSVVALADGGTPGDISPTVLQPQEPLLQYRAFRRMHAWSPRVDKEAWLDAWTELRNGRFRYQVVAERGAGSVRDRVLHKILEHEQQFVAEGRIDDADFTRENYEFSDGGTAPDGSRYLLLKPRRKDVLLVDGRMVLSPDGRELLRVEGRLAKNPSFWTTRVDVVRRYATLDGVRVPIAVETTAKIRFVGLSRLQVDYQYESVNGRPLSIAARRTLADAGR